MRIGEILKDSNPPLAKTLVEEVSHLPLISNHCSSAEVGSDSDRHSNMSIR